MYWKTQLCKISRRGLKGRLWAAVYSSYNLEKKRRIGQKTRFEQEEEETDRRILKKS